MIYAGEDLGIGLYDNFANFSSIVMPVVFFAAGARGKGIHRFED